MVRIPPSRNSPPLQPPCREENADAETTRCEDGDPIIEAGESGSRDRVYWHSRYEKRKD